MELGQTMDKMPVLGPNKVVAKKVLGLCPKCGNGKVVLVVRESSWKFKRAKRKNTPRCDSCGKWTDERLFGQSKHAISPRS